ncbi:hypothetical protein PSTG_14525 [Puccinia striiformis f. sp. tritici PST-78]|uniref:Uncharacterized protein n=1 Tax=Puccinia striiformis f. sp. tritici PST-78 TaxID=1165861 RepID=A0A0L0UYH0_9BASI|nr:hypothetical protein PSTG_14525 [Puccinia striiformis f. sp. tritici PST-78]
MRQTTALQACSIDNVGKIVRAFNWKQCVDPSIFVCRGGSDAHGLELPFSPPLGMLTTEDTKILVPNILNDRNYSPTSKDRETVNEYMSGMPSMRYPSGKSAQNLKGFTTPVEDENKMEEDFNSLRESLLRVGRPHGLTFGSLNPNQYLEPYNWDESHTFHQHVQKLRAIHQLMEEKLPASNGRSFIDTIPEEVVMIFNECVESLFALFGSTEPASASKDEFHFLNLQNLIGETIYFFHKHHLIDSRKIGSLLASQGPAEALSRHILRSYYEMERSAEQLPLNASSILKRWYSFTYGNMLKDYHQNQVNSFMYYFQKSAFQYYHNYPGNQRPSKLKNFMMELEGVIFDNNQIKGNDLSDRLEDEGEYALSFTSDSEGVNFLAQNFKDIYNNGIYQTELNHIYQAIQFIEDINPKAFKGYKNTKDFQEKYYLMSYSNSILEDLEHPEYKSQSISLSAELEILSKYIRIVELKYNEETEVCQINNHETFSIVKFFEELKTNPLCFHDSILKDFLIEKLLNFKSV